MLSDADLNASLVKPMTTFHCWFTNQNIGVEGDEIDEKENELEIDEKENELTFILYFEKREILYFEKREITE